MCPASFPRALQNFATPLGSYASATISYLNFPARSPWTACNARIQVSASACKSKLPAAGPASAAPFLLDHKGDFVLTGRLWLLAAFASSRLRDFRELSDSSHGDRRGRESSATSSQNRLCFETASVGFHVKVVSRLPGILGQLLTRFSIACSRPSCYIRGEHGSPDQEGR